MNDYQLAAWEYQRSVSHRLRRRARLCLGFHDAKIIHGPTVPYLETLSDPLDQGVADGKIAIDEADQAERAAIVIAGHDHNGQPRYLVCEAASIIGNEHTLAARKRSEIIARATGANATPAIVGKVIADSERQRAEELAVTVILIHD